jgi:hypothetical protein
MKVKCIRLLDADGREVEFSPWLTLGRIYHVMSIYMDANGQRSYGVISHHPKGEWPQLVRHQAECFEIVSSVVPSNWREWKDETATGVSPAAWQDGSFCEGFYDHDPVTYPIFERERDIILSEDP